MQCEYDEVCRRAEKAGEFAALCQAFSPSAALLELCISAASVLLFHHFCNDKRHYESIDVVERNCDPTIPWRALYELLRHTELCYNEESVTVPRGTYLDLFTLPKRKAYLSLEQKQRRNEDAYATSSIMTFFCSLKKDR